MKNNKNIIKKNDIISLSLHGLVVVVLIIMSVWSLRQNNLTMLQLRENVFNADKSGLDTEDALIDLRDFVSNHMNTELPKSGTGKAIQLKYSYERAINMEQVRFKEDSARFSQLAKQNCAISNNELARVDCEQAYIRNNPVTPVKNIAPETFSIEFVSPRWSFDRAGWLIMLTIGSLLFFLARLVSLFLAKRHIENNYN